MPPPPPPPISIEEEISSIENQQKKETIKLDERPPYDIYDEEYRKQLNEINKSMGAETDNIESEQAEKIKYDEADLNKLFLNGLNAKGRRATSTSIRLIENHPLITKLWENCLQYHRLSSYLSLLVSSDEAENEGVLIMMSDLESSSRGVIVVRLKVNVSPP
ncbi:unnamed protein product [Hymenolepis diminuta]|uniref:Uncharacterized protein n=1 Tax=Hymenolepis diminuta TaxID=6216 RepID=A0A564YK97_HYMDI|nr:unnamed protein product [Hymenolepis diminuta]